MATERQIAANRQNAGKSSGPRSSAGKKRASRNARTHGLTMSLLGAAFSRKAEALARKIAGRTKDPIILEYARSAAHASLELARVRQVKVSVINRACEPGKLSVSEVVRRVLPELTKFARYEMHAVAQRDRAFREINQRIKHNIRTIESCSNQDLPNEADISY